MGPVLDRNSVAMPGELAFDFAIANTGSYQWMWYADIALSTFAALVNLPITEARVEPKLAAAN